MHVADFAISRLLASAPAKITIGWSAQFCFSWPSMMLLVQLRLPRTLCVRWSTAPNQQPLSNLGKNPEARANCLRRKLDKGPFRSTPNACAVRVSDDA